MKSLDFYTDRLPMYGAVLVGISTSAYLAFSIMPDIFSKVIFAVFCGGLPLISVRFLIKRRMRFFWISVVLIVFSDVSMVLSLTASQAHEITVQASGDDQTPAPLQRLQKATDAAQKGLDELVAQQSTAQTKAFLDILSEQIKTATTSRDEAQKREAEWIPAVLESKGVVSSHDVFMAIPIALISLDLSRYMTLVFALLVAIVYQGTVINTVSATVRTIRREEAKPTPKKKHRARAKAAVIPTGAPVAEDFAPATSEEGEGFHPTMPEVL